MRNLMDDADLFGPRDAQGIGHTEVHRKEHSLRRSGLDDPVGCATNTNRRPVVLAEVQVPHPSSELLAFADGKRFKTIMADPPWRFQNSTGKVAPEHKRLNRYGTMTLADIQALPVARIAADTSHLYLWVPNALLPDGLAVMQAVGFTYQS